MSFYHKRKRLFGIICLCLGVGILLVIILPTWGWLALAGIGLVCLGWYYVR